MSFSSTSDLEVLTFGATCFGCFRVMNLEDINIHKVLKLSAQIYMLNWN